MNRHSRPDPVSYVVSQSGERSDQSLERGLFFATDEAERYDATVGLVNPAYGQMHEMLRRLTVEHLRGGQKGGKMILDIGSGTSAELIPLLEQCRDLRALA